MAKAIGIDLGTSTSSVAYFDGRQARLLELDEGWRLMPTLAQHDPYTGKVATGLFAHRTTVSNPEFTYSGLKRLLGRQFNDPLVQDMSERISYSLSYGPNGEAWVKTPEGQESPEALLAHVLRQLKMHAQAGMGEQVSFAVVGVPASFDYPQKMAVRRACAMAGLDVRKLVHEPTAAAVAYGMERGLGKTIAVYDFGGGTFDATILKVNGRRYKVLGTAGDPFLGGEDFDVRLVDHVADRFARRYGIDPRADTHMLLRLRLAVEKAKVELSGVDEYRIHETKIAKELTTHSLIDLDETVTRAELEEIVEDLIDRTRRPCLDALQMAKVDVRDVDDVVLVGGMTRMPRVQEAVRELFGRTPAHSRINPVEAVTIGCAVLAAAIAGETKTVLLEDIVATNFGVEASGGSFVPIIRRGTRLPFSVTRNTAPIDPTLTRVAARISQGDAGNAAENARIGTIVLDGLPEDPDADKEIAVTFALDEDAVLSVTLAHAASGRSETRRYDANSGLDAEAMEQLRGLGEDDEVGPEPEAAEEKVAENAESDRNSSVSEDQELPEEAPEQADPLESEAPDSAPVDLQGPPADAESAGGVDTDVDDDPPPMPSAPRWAADKVAAE